jgi:Zn-dependent peptidase ImmA (M78 family)/transcriptional regulator with XRE-family HTH domain
MQTVDYEALGRRLQQAREQARMSQKEAAQHLEVTAAALSQYESGKRKIGALALGRLARLYGVPLSSLFSERESEERPDWERALLGKTEGLSPEGRKGVAKLVRRARQFHELHGLAGVETPKTPHHPFEPLPERNYPGEEVELFAEEARDFFDLGSAPLPEVKSFLEQFGAFVFGIPLGDADKDLSGLFFTHPELGPVVAVNSDQYYGRRPFTLGHELAHVLFHYDRPSILCRSREKPPSERFADSFSARFLVPRKALLERLRTMDVEKVQHPETIVHLSRHFGISYLAMYHRLRAEGKIDRSAADYKDVRPLGLARQLGYAPSSQEYGGGDWPLEDQLPQRYIELTHKAWDDGAISKRRAAEVLGISHLELEDRMEEEAAPLESPEAYHGLQ